MSHSRNVKGVKTMNAIEMLDSIQQAVNISDRDMDMFIHYGFTPTHIIGAAISCNSNISDSDLLKIAKCIIGNVNYRNHVPATKNDNIIDEIDIVLDRYIDR